MSVAVPLSLSDVEAFTGNLEVAAVYLADEWQDLLRLTETVAARVSAWPTRPDDAALREFVASLVERIELGMEDLSFRRSDISNRATALASEIRQDEFPPGPTVWAESWRPRTRAASTVVGVVTPSGDSLLRLVPALLALGIVLLLVGVVLALS